MLATYFPQPDVGLAAHEVGNKAISVEILIGEDGNVLHTKAVSGAEQLRPSAEAAASKARFRITTKSLVPVQVRCRLMYNFDPKLSSIRILDCSDCNDRVISIDEPKYPVSVEFGAHKYSGVVSIQVLIGADGDVESAKAVSGHTFFRDYLQREIQGAKFKPTIVNGPPVRKSVIVKYQVISRE